MSKRQNIPAAMLAPVISDKWIADKYSLGKFATQIEGHKAIDEREHSTAMYVLREGEGVAFGGGINHKELQAMGDHVPDVFVVKRGSRLLLNQHYSHSLDQMYAEIQNAYNDHVKRTNAIIGKPAGTIRESRAA